MKTFFQAARENLFGHVSFVQRRTPGMLIRDVGGALLVDAGLASDTFNKVLWGCDGNGPCAADPDDGALLAAKEQQNG